MSKLNLASEFLIVVEDGDNIELDDEVGTILDNGSVSYELDDIKGVACYMHVENISDDVMQTLRFKDGLGIYKVDYTRLEN